MSEVNADRWLLEVTGASRPPASMPLSGVLVLGSDPKRAGYVVTGNGIESAHCAIGRTKGGGFAIKDLGTSAGTIVNGKRVESARLSAGDVLLLGTVSLRVVDPAAPNTPPPKKKTETAPDLDTAELLAALAPMPAPATAKSEVVEETNFRSTPLPAIPGYKIDKRVGRGGMGDVYLAVQESLARQVALKILSQKWEENREFVRRFQAEARAAAALNHPNVVTVYDVGEAAGKHYLSMEFMDRGNLEDRLKNGARIQEREVLDILRDATSGLVYAEARGIVHRDLKPANLMQNHVGTTKIADLGLATHVESEEAQPADKKIFGTPHFMSPEQVRGERVDSRSDLYSLGATAYRLLTGRTPFEGRDAREIVKAVLRDEPKPMREFAPDVTAGTSALVERLMKKDAAQRYASASETLAELERLRNPSQHAVTIEAGQEGKKSSKGGLVVVLLLIAGGAAYWFSTREKKGPVGPAHTDPPLAHGTTNQTRPDPSENGEPRVDPAPPVKPVEPPKPRDKDDKDLQLFEAQGKLALIELMAREMPETERREALRALSSQFQGTSAATEALEKADAITNRILAEESSRALRKTEVDTVMAKLNAAAKLEDVPPHPGLSFLAMRAVDGQATVRDYPEFVEQRKTLETIVCRTANAYADQVMTEAGRTFDRGDYDAGLAQLTALEKVFDALPDFPPGETPAGVSELFEKGRIVRERLHTLEQTREPFERKRDAQDALSIALGFAGPSGMEKELRQLDFAAAKKRVDNLLNKVGKGPARALLTELSADCERARVVLETLGRECAAGAWRRKSFSDPREKKGVTRNATGADATGLLFDGDGGASDHVPWSAFGGNTKELSKLFFERLTRDWTAAELHGIAALLRMEACVEVVDLSAKMFDPNKKSNFTEGNHKDILEIGTTLAAWTPRAPDERAETAKEMEAAGILALALRQMTETQWSTSVSQIERLLYEFQGTLLVRLLSNGKPPEEPK